MTSTMSTPAQRLIDAMEAYGRVGQMLRWSQGGFWSYLQLTVPQIRALGLIACSGRSGRSGRELASQLGVGPSAITPLVDRLVEHGYVSRHEDPIDRRIQRLRATEAGVELLQRMASLRRETLAEIVARIDPQDIPVVEHALEILVQAVERLAHEPEPATAATH
jgi:DNA-binding MarR family transcriptional regulator